MGKESFQILNGNELIIQGAREAGFHLYTGYPGSPLADFFNILHERKNDFQKEGIRVVIANSEANAAAMASGAKQAHKNTLVAMKSMGLHVASDALSVGNFANPGTGGVVVVVGDDPWSISTSSPADSRYLFKHLHIPFLDPSTPQELKDWIKIALQISQKTSVYQGLLLTTFMAEGGGRVEIFSDAKINTDLIELNPEDFDLSKNVMVPPNSFKADVAMINERFPKVYEVLKELSLDKIFGNRDSKIGFISSGAVFEILKHVLDDNHSLERFSLYKIAAPYPIVPDLIIDYLRNLETLIVVEEKRGFLENEIRELASTYKLNLKIIGKKMEDNSDAFIAFGGLNYDLILNTLTKIFTHLNLGPCHSSNTGSSLDETLPRRLPTFCPGCPHRETLSLLKDLRITLKGKNINLMSHGDVGCYSLSFLEPFKEMHNLSAMGQGGALGAGVDLFTTNPSIVLMGDSTFFHSGITDISNSVQMDHSITYILLDNDNTAMTGHQMTPRTGVSVEGFKRPPQDMMNMVKALGVSEVIEVNPSDRYFYQNLLSETVLKKGVKVIISNKECGLTFHGKKKSVERKIFAENKTLDQQIFYQINTDACEDCRMCVEMTGCPGLTQVFDAYGSKVSIDPQICVSDSYCTKIKACPSFEEVIVYDYHPTKYKTHSNNFQYDFNSIPLPKVKKSFDQIASGIDYRVVVTGVGGTGVTTISKILSSAALKMNDRSDLDFKFVDQKGLAQRNGNVTGHLFIFKKGKSHSQITPTGTADLLVSPDLLDGSQHLNFIGKEGTVILDEKFQMPLSILLDKGESIAPLNNLDLKNKITNKLKEQLKLVPMKDISEQYLGKSVYASAMVLGVAFQIGTIPFSLEELLQAFEVSVPKSELKNNITAFQLGRLFVHSPSDLKLVKNNEGLELINLLKESLVLGNQKVEIFEKMLSEIKLILPSMPEEHLAHYLHDIMIYSCEDNLISFKNDLQKLAMFYNNNDELLQIAVRTLSKTYFIKDEVFVAHQMISPMRHSSDFKKYGDLGTSFDKKFINRPSIDITENKVIEFDFSPRPWMLKIMSKMHFLRSVLPHWHKKEREIALKTRRNLLAQALNYQALKKLDNIKGYREVRFKSAT
jgi:indolepyruvate ferredoxin oxidoreductase